MYKVVQECGNDAMKWYLGWDGLAERTYEAAKKRLKTNPQGMVLNKNLKCHHILLIFTFFVNCFQNKYFLIHFFNF